jgi:PDZ domain-containing protein
VMIFSGGSSGSNPVKIRAVSPFGIYDSQRGKSEVPWLGAAVEEAPEVLTAQLSLGPGVGLVVTYVATNSPAAKAGLEKNDVLVEFDGQPLVHPMQLRKLVQVRKEGDAIKLVFYRAGKKQTVTATLAKTTAGLGSSENPPVLGQYWEGYAEEPRAGAKLLLPGTQDQVRRSMDEARRASDQARRAYDQALKTGTNKKEVLASNVEALRKSLEDLSRANVALNKGATVTVRSTGGGMKSIVESDDSGAIVILKNPKLRLTAHDKDGKLTFDGEIETPEQRAQVPPELWKRVEPLLDKLTPSSEPTPKARPGSI